MRYRKGERFTKVQKGVRADDAQGASAMIFSDDLTTQGGSVGIESRIRQQRRTSAGEEGRAVITVGRWEETKQDGALGGRQLPLKKPIKSS